MSLAVGHARVRVVERSGEVPARQKAVVPEPQKTIQKAKPETTGHGEDHATSVWAFPTISCAQLLLQEDSSDPMSLRSKSAYKDRAVAYHKTEALISSGPTEPEIIVPAFDRDGGYMVVRRRLNISV